MRCERRGLRRRSRLCIHRNYDVWHEVQWKTTCLSEVGVIRGDLSFTDERKLDTDMHKTPHVQLT